MSIFADKAKKGESIEGGWMGVGKGFSEDCCECAMFSMWSLLIVPLAQ